ncbi:MAG: alpha/beta hydrolase [Lachnospiraceae bacterium]|nr:alpha/beta hydrolase [Lachnospiraceae bacterium]
MQDFMMDLDRSVPAADLKRSVMEAAQEYSDKNALSAKDGRHLCLAAEETMEMLSLLKDRRPGKLCIVPDENGVVLRLTTDLYPGGDHLSEQVDFEKEQGVTGKLRLIYECGFEGLEKNASSAEEIGVRKAEPSDLKAMGLDSSSEAYVWSLQSYNITAFDHTIEDDAKEWLEISHSILANLSDDIRLFVFPDKTELNVRLSTGQEGVTGEYAISHEFDALRKLPVFKTPFQVKMIQLIYGGLVRKQKSKPGLEIKKFTVPTGHSKKGQITVLEYRPESVSADSPAVIFYHGGADLFPALPYHYKLSEKIATKAGCRVFLTMQDLAPKYNPPIQILEGIDIYRYLLENEEHKVSPDKVAVMGDSSGGTLAAAVALLARDGMVPLPKGQLLLYPSLDMRYNTPSMKKYTDVPIINTEAINSYRNIVHSDWSFGNKYYMSPAEAQTFEGLCDTYVETTEFDPLHDEGVEYAKKLKAAGVNVILNETKGTVHSFDMADDSSIVEAAVESRVDFLKRLFFD